MTAGESVSAIVATKDWEWIPDYIRAFVGATLPKSSHWSAVERAFLEMWKPCCPRPEDAEIRLAHWNSFLTDDFKVFRLTIQMNEDGRITDISRG